MKAARVKPLRRKPSRQKPVRRTSAKSAAEIYARRVLHDNSTGLLIRKAAARFLSDLKRKDLIFDLDEANKVVNFFERYLCHWEGVWRGLPIILEDWQKFILQQTFGWQRRSNGRRRIRSVYVQIARKNAKTTLAAGIAIYHVFADRENTPQVLVGANNEDQAKICVNTVGRIIEISPELATMVAEKTVELFQYKDNIVNIVHREHGGVIKAISKEPGTKDGFNPSLGIIDEYHEADTDKLLNVIESGQGARPEPLLFCITTAGFNKFGPCYTKLRDTSVRILEEGAEDDAHLAFIYEQDKEDRWDDQSTWRKSNPNLEVSVYLEYLQQRMQKAKIEGGTKEVDFKTKNLDIWTDVAQAFIPDEVWAKNSHGTKLEDLEGVECYGGMYYAPEALNVFLLYFPNFNGLEVYRVWCWLPEGSVEDGNPDWHKWIDEELITKIPGNKVSPSDISADILKILVKFDCRIVAFDVNSMAAIAPDLDQQGFPVLAISQVFKNLKQPHDDFHANAIAGKIEHFNNPIFRWHVRSTITHQNKDGESKPDRRGSSTRIGCVSAALNAMAAKNFAYKDGVMTDFEFKSL